MQELIRQKIADSLTVKPPAFTRRDVWLPKTGGKALAVIGMRRAGKTTFLWQCLRERLERGAPREALLYFNFEDERLAGLSAGRLALLSEEYFRLCPRLRDTGRVTFFLDEIQVVPGWEQYVRRLLDEEKIEVMVSGSSAKLLSKEIATSLRGRGLATTVFPFSFREYLRHLGAEPKRGAILARRERSLLDQLLGDFLAGGGFPETIGADERERVALLQSYVDVAVFRDVIERHGIGNVTALKSMVRHLLGNPSGLFSVQKFFNDLKSRGVSVGKNTLHEMLGCLEDAFMVRVVSLDSNSERQRQVNPRKIYPADSGLIGAYATDDGGGTGRALETCVAIELERRGARLSYVLNADGGEIDFLARYPEGRAELIQVSADISREKTLSRELAAFERLERQYAGLPKLLITMTPHLAAAPSGKIRIVSAAEWLLADEVPSR